MLGWLKRPIELSLVEPVPGSTIEIGHIRMLDPSGQDVLANGNFSRGTERWYFTDDQHAIWRIENQYLMTLFESGVVGLASFVLLAGTALAGAMRAMGRGDRMAAPVAASLIAFLCSGVFDYLFEGPRLAALFYIIAFCGLTMMQAPEFRPAVSAISRDRSASRSDRPAIPG
jgi:O-antigen ligase